jgi:hypothetical protein
LVWGGAFPRYSLKIYPSTMLYYIMGRNSLTYRQRLEDEVNRWSPFRKALLADEREVFDRLVDQAFRYVHAGTMYPLRDAFDIFLMSSLLSHEDRLGVLEKMLKVSMKVDGRLGP